MNEVVRHNTRSAVLYAPYRIDIVDTTASFAAKPEIRLTATFQLPNPQGLNIGAISFPKVPIMLYCCQRLNANESRFSKSQMIILASKITVPTLVRKSLTLSHI